MTFQAIGTIAQMKSLSCRESGHEKLRYPAFTRQFESAVLQRNQLDRKVDGVSGTALSVWVMGKIARLALYL